MRQMAQSGLRRAVGLAILAAGMLIAREAAAQVATPESTSTETTVSATYEPDFSVLNDTTIDATAICELLRKLSGRYPGLPLTLVLDNARYQRCEPVRLLAAELRIELLYLPS